MYPVHPRHQTSSLHSPVLTARHFLIGSLSYLVILLGGIVTDSEPRSSMTPPHTQRRSPVASTDLLGASRGRLRTGETRQTPRITPEQAAAFAVNDLHSTPEGYMLRHPRHLASFTRDGVHFTARRGGLEWHWQLTHIETNEAPLREVELGAVPPVQDAIGTVSYIRGEGVVEHYRTQARGLEQQFVIMRLLALAGADLVIRGQVQSAGTLAATPQGWEWRTEQGAVNLGAVKVVDATRQTVPATMEVTAEETRITVAGTALAQATYPVTIDPEIGASDFRISDMGPDGDPKFNVFDPAIAYNSINNEYLVVWSGTDNTGLLVDSESEIFGQRINAETGAEVGENDFRLSDMGPDGDPNFVARAPAVA